MVEHWLHNSMVPGSNPGGDGIFFLSSYHFTTSLLTSFGSACRWSPGGLPWSPAGPPMARVKNPALHPGDSG